MSNCIWFVTWIALSKEFNNKKWPECIQQQNLHLGEQNRWRYIQILSKQTYQGTQCTRLVGEICCLGGRFRNRPALQSGGKFGKESCPEALGFTLTTALPIYSYQTVPDFVVWLYASGDTISNRCPHADIELGNDGKIAGIRSDPDDRADLSPGKFFCEPPGSTSQHTHIQHSVSI